MNKLFLHEYYVTYNVDVDGEYCYMTEDDDDWQIAPLSFSVNGLNASKVIDYIHQLVNAEGDYFSDITFEYNKVHISYFNPNTGWSKDITLTIKEVPNEEGDNNE